MSLVALSFLWASSPLAANVEAAFQYRPRAELRTTDPARSPAAQVGHRARLGMSFEADSLTGFFALQDVRGWGAEGDTLKDFDANGLDLHEGFLSWTTTESLSLKVGRQEIAMQEHRLMPTLQQHGCR